MELYDPENITEKGENALDEYFLHFPIKDRKKSNLLWHINPSSIYTHFNTLKKKALGKTLWKKVKLLK